jgi:hypothetical protein
MTAIHDEALMRAAFAPARDLEPTDAEVAAVLSLCGDHARAPRRAPARAWRRRGPVARRLAPIAAALVVVLLGGYAAAPPVRAALDDIAGSFSGWLGGSGDAPGRPLSSGESAPGYFRDPAFTSAPRVVAEAGGYRMFAARAAGGGIDFDLGETGVGIGLTPGSFREHALLVLGPGAMQRADRRGHVPLFGVTARQVASVELTYRSGPPLRVDGVRGAFVLLAEPARSPREVVAVDAGGRELGRQLVDDSDHTCPCIDWTQYLRSAPTAPPPPPG